MLINPTDINTYAPYRVESTQHDGEVTFITDYGVRYLVEFEEDNSLMSFRSYQLVVINANNKKTRRDPKIKATIIAIIENFFKINNSTLLYICETGDQKQHLRSKLFEYWFANYERNLLYTMLSSSIVDEEGVVNYAAIVLRNDNPNITQIVAEFAETVRILTQKPD